MTRTINYSWIDPNMRLLVRVLNSLPGIRTMGSCGGHENPNEIQQPKGHFFVSFKAYHTKGGLDSLSLIAFVAMSCRQGKGAVWVEASGSGTARDLWFSLVGDDVEPELVAETFLALATSDYRNTARRWLKEINTRTPTQKTAGNTSAKKSLA